MYIGGTHPAVAGGACMVLLSGFLGLRFENGRPTLRPRQPKGWRRVRLKLRYRGESFLLDSGERIGGHPHTKETETRS